MSEFTFRDLYLNDVEVEKGGRTLSPGQHICRIAEAKFEKKGGNAQVKVLLEAVDGSGYVRDNFNIKHQNSQAQEIARRQFKTLLAMAKHPNPSLDQDEGIETLLNLMVGVNVIQGEDWTDNDGVRRAGGGKPAKSGAYFTPVGEEHEGAQAGKPNGSAGYTPPPAADELNDRIPF